MNAAYLLLNKKYFCWSRYRIFEPTFHPANNYTALIEFILNSIDYSLKNP